MDPRISIIDPEIRVGGPLPHKMVHQPSPFYAVPERGALGRWRKGFAKKLPQLVILACLLAISFVGPTASYPPADRLDMVRSAPQLGKDALLGIPQSQPGRWAIHDAAVAQRIEYAILALPVVDTGGTRFCPLDSGVRYHMTFWRKYLVVLQVTAEAGGCEDIDLGGGDVRQGDYDLWVLLSQVLHQPIEEVFP